MKLSSIAWLTSLALAATGCTRQDASSAAPPAPPAPATPPPTTTPSPLPTTTTPTTPGSAEVVGNGQSAQETRPAADFASVTSTTSLDVRVTQGAGFLVVVTADANVLPRITTTVANGVLTVGSVGAFSTRVPSHVDVTLPRFAGAEDDGSGDLTVTATQAQAVALVRHGSGDLSFTGPAGAVTLDLLGSGTTTLSGSGASLEGTARGSGVLDARGFTVAGATLELSGSGTTSLTVRGNARVRLVGSGNVDARFDQGTADLTLVGSGHIAWTGSATPGVASAAGSGTITHGP